MNTILNVDLTPNLKSDSMSADGTSHSGEISFRANRSGDVEVVAITRKYSQSKPAESAIGTIRKSEARAIVDFFSQLA